MSTDEFARASQAYVDSLMEWKRRGYQRGFGRGADYGVACAILIVLSRRHITVPDAVRDRILACTNSIKLPHWLQLAVTVANVDELFALVSLD